MISALTILEDCQDDEALLHDSDRPSPPDTNLRPAAVLLPLIHDGEQWHLQFIRRARSERDRHSGQVAFPGGAHESQDSSMQDTALREAHEEIGLPATSVSIVAQLRDYTTISHYVVTPFVGVVEKPFVPQLQLDEVARTFSIPVDWLRVRSNFTLRAREDMDPESARKHPVIVYEPYDGEVLWGASARMAINCLHAIDSGDVTLPER